MVKDNVLKITTLRTFRPRKAEQYGLQGSIHACDRLLAITRRVMQGAKYRWSGAIRDVHLSEVRFCHMLWTAPGLLWTDRFLLLQQYFSPHRSRPLVTRHKLHNPTFRSVHHPLDLQALLCAL